MKSALVRVTGSKRMLDAIHCSLITSLGTDIPYAGGHNGFTCDRAHSLGTSNNVVMFLSGRQ